MRTTQDRLYNLLPVYHRMRDAEEGYPLRALLRVIAEQVDIVEDDIAQLYANWFIETAADWVVPYIGDLVGYRPVFEAGEPGDVRTSQGLRRNKILIPRREVANTVAFRRRKGTLSVLEDLAAAVTGWPARAVEFYRLLSWNQALNHQRLDRGRTVDLRHGDALPHLDGPFDELAHTVEVRRIGSRHDPGRSNIPSVGLFVWRLRAYPVTRAPAWASEVDAGRRYTFSPLGRTTQLFTQPQRETEATGIAGPLNVPAPIDRRTFERHRDDYYGPDKSMQIWRGSLEQPVPIGQIVVADLSDWSYQPAPDQLAIDPVLGRIALCPPEADGSTDPLWVSYHYGFSADMGGGEYSRALRQLPIQAHENDTRPVYRYYQVSRAGLTLSEALEQWNVDQPQHAVIELVDSGEYFFTTAVEPEIELKQGQTLQLRAANHCRPVIWLSDRSGARSDYLEIRGEEKSRLALDGLLIAGLGLRIRGELVEVVIRHCTLEPGLMLDHGHILPEQGSAPSIDLRSDLTRLAIEHSIVGPIHIHLNQVSDAPVNISISDSIIDAGSAEQVAIGVTHHEHAAAHEPVRRATGAWAHAALSIARCTIFGEVWTHAIDLAENSIFSGRVNTARRQHGCVRFCYIPPLPETRTPRRYACQPETAAAKLAAELIEAQAAKAITDKITPSQRYEAIQRTVRAMKPSAKQALTTQAQALAEARVRPQFSSLEYGTPGYCQLASSCPAEIMRGADDEAELGAFHDLFQPQRAANLRARLDEYTPAGMEAGIIYAS